MENEDDGVKEEEEVKEEAKEEAKEVAKEDKEIEELRSRVNFYLAAVQV